MIGIPTLLVKTKRKTSHPQWMTVILSTQFEDAGLPVVIRLGFQILNRFIEEGEFVPVLEINEQFASIKLVDALGQTFISCQYQFFDWEGMAFE